MFLWFNGVDVYVEYREEIFNLKVMLLSIINDIFGYVNLFRYSIKGYMIFFICEYDIYLI